jgi:O-Antigen ligase/Tetratricopeptide repeat
MSQALISERTALARRLPSAAAFDPWLAGVGSCLLIGGVAAASGGYFPTSWGWTSLALLWVAALVVLLRGGVELGFPELVFFGSLTLFAGWIWLGTIWSEDVPGSFLEGQRALVYVAGIGAALLLVRRRTVPQLLGGVTTAITLISGYALATRLFPDRIATFDPIAGYRLETPIGYWNALGIFAAMGTLLALGFAARGRSPVPRAVSAAALAILLPTLYFTYSRGAWIGLGLGVIVAISYETNRLQLVTAFALASTPPAAAVVFGSRLNGLTQNTASIASAAHDGKRFALVIVGAAMLSAALLVAQRFAEQRLMVPRWLRIAYVGLLVALVAVGCATAIARYGSPPTMARKAYDSFVTKPGTNNEANLNKHLFQLAGSGRAQLWHVAWLDVTAHPWLGSGPGTFEQEWDRHRSLSTSVRDAHNLYLEQLAEVGPLGLALLVLGLVTPLALAVRARGAPLAGAALAAYSAFLFHAAIDWDWELPAVTLSALLCGIAILAYARRVEEKQAFARFVRPAAIAVAAALGALAFVGLVGNLALASSRTAAGHKDWSKSAAQARRASDWAPWSSDAPDLLGQAELQQGRTAAAAASFRRAISKDPKNWQLWLDLYSATSGAESRQAFRRTYQLNPRGDAG